jgi:hypothetical protein
MRIYRGKTLWQGVAAGLLGYATIIVYYVALNLLRGRSPFDTVARLGWSIFGANDVLPRAGAVIAYNGLHLVFFLLLGVIVARLIEEVELHPDTWYVVFFALLAMFLFTTVFLASLTADAGITTATLIAGNVLAAGVMAFYLGDAHRGLLYTIEQQFRDSH